MRRNQKNGLIAGLVMLAVLASGSFIGSMTAATPEDAEMAEMAAYREGYSEFRNKAFLESRKRGYLEGVTRGRKAGRRLGVDEGTTAAYADLEAAERAANCGAPLFVDGYCPTDEEIAYESNAETYCGGGDYETAAALGIRC